MTNQTPSEPSLIENIYFREAAREQVEALMILHERLSTGNTLRVVRAEETVMEAINFIHALWEATDDYIRTGLKL